MSSVYGIDWATASFTSATIPSNMSITGYYNTTSTSISSSNVLSNKTVYIGSTPFEDYCCRCGKPEELIKPIPDWIEENKKNYKFADLKDIYDNLEEDYNPIYLTRSYRYKRDRNLKVVFDEEHFANYSNGWYRKEAAIKIAEQYEKIKIKEVTKMTIAEYEIVKKWAEENGADKFEIEYTGFTTPTINLEVNIESFKKLVLGQTKNTVAPRNGNQIYKDYQAAGCVKKVECYNDRVVKVTFSDGTFTKSVCSENDRFDLDTGITICLMKRMLGNDGNKMYNNAIRRIHKIMEDNLKAKEEEKIKKAEIKEKNRQQNLKRANGKKKARQEQIDIQKEAILAALREKEGD